MEAKKYWIGFNLIKGIGALPTQGLIVYIGDPRSARRVSLADLAGAGPGSKLIGQLDQARERVEIQGIKTPVRQDEACPQRWKDIDQPLPVLHIRGGHLPDGPFAVVIEAAETKGADELIEKGALPLSSANDLMQALDITRVADRRDARRIMQGHAMDAKLLNAPGSELVRVDGICNQAELPTEDVSAALALMELKGMACQAAGMNYVAMREMQADCSINSWNGE